MPWFRSGSDYSAVGKQKKERKKWHKGYVEKAASGMFLRLKERTSRTYALIIMREKRKKKNIPGYKINARVLVRLTTFAP